jgi:hypothetical protein
MREEYALTIFYLIGQSSKLDATDKLNQIMINSLPNMEESDARSYINTLQLESSDGVIDLDRDENASDKLKAIFGA